MDTKQQQHLLSFLGFYTGDCDGLSGPKTKNAIRSFQSAYGLQTDGICGKQTEKALRGAVAGTMEPVNSFDALVSETLNSSYSFARYFAKEEFRCRCGGKYCNGYPAEISKSLLTLADRTREYFNRPMHNTSGLRCEKHNAAEGGVAGSYHTKGKAVDFYIDGVPAEEILAYVKAQPEVHYAYHIQNSNCVHMDVF